MPSTTAELLCLSIPVLFALGILVSACIDLWELRASTRPAPQRQR